MRKVSHPFHLWPEGGSPVSEGNPSRCPTQQARMAALRAGRLRAEETHIDISLATSGTSDILAKPPVCLLCWPLLATNPDYQPLNPLTCTMRRVLNGSCHLETSNQPTFPKGYTTGLRAPPLPVDKHGQTMVNWFAVPLRRGCLRREGRVLYKIATRSLLDHETVGLGRIGGKSQVPKSLPT